MLARDERSEGAFGVNQARSKLPVRNALKRRADDKGHKEELDRIKRDLAFANERAEDSSRNKSSEVSGIMSKYNRQLTELEDSLRVSHFYEPIAAARGSGMERSHTVKSAP